jgi:hypothetical protein
MTNAKTRVGVNKAVELLDKVIEGREDFVYGQEFPFEDTGTTSCRYVVNDCPACLVAQVLHNLGVSIDELKEIEGMVIRSAPLPDWLVMTPVARLVLSRAQTKQDDDYSWGDAVKVAKEFAKTLERDD